MFGGSTVPSGNVSMRLLRGRETRDRVASAAPWPARELSLAEIAHFGLPRNGLDDRINLWRTRNIGNLWRGVRRALTARALRLPTFYGTLYITHLKANGQSLDYGLASMRVVTTAGVGFIVDALQGSVEPELLRYHGVGTGTNAEASGDTALQTESTTILTVDSTRATGTLTEGASANIFRTVGVVSFDGSGGITEHGILSQAATGGGTLLDRSVFSAINVVSGDSISFTFDLTLPSGS